MRVLRSPTFAKVLHLHDLREHRYIQCRCCSLREIVSLKDFFVLNCNIQENWQCEEIGNVPDGKHLCASTFEGTSVGLWAFRPSVVARAPYPLVIVVPRGERVFVPPPRVPPLGAPRPLSPA